MKMTTKLGLISLSIFSVGALSACQSTQSQSLDNNERHRHAQLTAEQKQQHQTHRTERKQAFAQMQKACDGKKLGESVQLQVGDKSIAGQCQMTFKPDHQARSEHQAEHGSHRQMMHMERKNMENMTAAQREQVMQQFSTQRAQHRATWQALQKACDGQAPGKTIQAKMGEQLISGQCLVKFQPNENAMRTRHSPTSNHPQV